MPCDCETKSNLFDRRPTGFYHKIWTTATGVAGIEPATRWLTVSCTTAVLHANKNYSGCSQFSIYSTVLATSFIASLRNGCCPDSILQTGRRLSVNVHRHWFISEQYHRLIFMFEIFQSKPVEECVIGINCCFVAVVFFHVINIIFKCLNNHLTILLWN